MGARAVGDSDVRAPGGVEVSPATHHDVSGPLRDAAVTPAGAPTFKEHKLHPLPQASATPTVQPSSGTSPSASGVAGLAQSNGGITAAAACTSDSSAFAGSLSP